MSKQKLIDQINDAFIKVAYENNSKEYARYIKAINKDLIANIDTLTQEKAKQIINSQKLNINDIALLFVIQNIVIEIINKPRQAKKNKSIAPLLVILGMYSLSNPTKFVERVDKLIKGKDLNSNEVKAKELLNTFEQQNNKVLLEARKKAFTDINTSIKKSKVSKRMLSDFKTGVESKQSIGAIKKDLLKKYNNENNVNRALETELHRASETIRQAHSVALGYTHKTWKTQADARVRKTCFHNGVKNKRIPIESDFRSCGMKAQRPSDYRLPPNESIRCRCYLIYD